MHGSGTRAKIIIFSELLLAYLSADMAKRSFLFQTLTWLNHLLIYHKPSSRTKDTNCYGTFERPCMEAVNETSLENLFTK